MLPEADSAYEPLVRAALSMQLRYDGPQHATARYSEAASEWQWRQGTAGCFQRSGAGTMGIVCYFVTDHLGSTRAIGKSEPYY